MSQNKLRIGIVGYGNLGKGAEKAIQQNQDMELIAVFTRRKPDELQSGVPVVALADIREYKGRIDVMLLCGGSAKDLPGQVQDIARDFHTVDSFDTHAKIPEYFATVDRVAQQSKTLSLISCGWDPGLFSIARLLGQVVLPVGEDYTFWGKGLSQGHSDAIRRVAGVKNGVQYTVPIDSALERVRNGENPTLSTAEKHERICYVVPGEDADPEQIEEAIKTMPHYFSDYHTTVHFITEEELKENHAAMPHGGHVFRSGITGDNTKQRVEFTLELESNPEFTASVLVAYARAIGKMAAKGETGARTVFDIPPGYLSPKSPETLRKELL